MKKKIKTIGLTTEQYEEIIEAGKACGFNMNAGRNGQRGKFLAIAAKIARFTILSERQSHVTAKDSGNAVG